MATTKPLVALIIASTRNPRCGPQAAQFVMETFQTNAAKFTFTPELLDLADHPLPLFDEPFIPSQVHRAEDYAHEHTRAWSRKIAGYAGFIFVTPQYNWGYPATLKNSIDYLFKEWNGKAGMIVSYGGRGGGKAAAQLREVLHGVDMRPAATMPALSIPRAGMMKTQKGEEIGATGEDSIWKDNRPEVVKAFEELDMLLSEPLPQQTKSG